MRLDRTATPVTVVPSPHHGGLGITRTLGRLGIEVFNVDGERWCPAFFSRYCKGRLVHDLDAATERESVEALVALARRIGARSILVPTTDGAARLIADSAEALRRHFIFPPQPPELIRALLSKKEMLELARRHGILAPAAVFPQNRAELLEAPDHLGLPLIVKGVRGDTWARTSRSKVLVRSRAQFRALCDLLPDAVVAELMVQEYIAGKEDTVWMFNGYFDARSNCRAAFTGRKLRQCPAYAGVASLAAAEKNPAVEDAAEMFMKSVGYCGIADIDFRYDARDGRYKILDVNPRVGSTFRLFVSEDGMDVVRAMYLDLTGQDIPASPQRAGRKWMVEDLDVAAAWGYARENSLGFIDWLKSLQGVDELSFFAWDDPVPVALMLLADLRELCSRSRLRARRIPPFYPKSPAAPARKPPAYEHSRN
jgi:predicted ATP-grasp superfamily ATP-dependent carboligase